MLLILAIETTINADAPLSPSAGAASDTGGEIGQAEASRGTCHDSEDNVGSHLSSASRENSP